MRQLTGVSAKNLAVEARKLCARSAARSLPRQPKMALATIQVFGEYLDCQDLIFPGSAGTPAALSGRSSCFWGSFSE